MSEERGVLLAQARRASSGSDRIGNGVSHCDRNL